MSELAAQDAPVTGLSVSEILPLGVSTYQDPFGDAYWPQGDLGGVGVDAAADGYITSAVTVYQFDNPYSVNWQLGDTGILWFYDVNLDGSSDYYAGLVNVNGSLGGAVIDEATQQPVCPVDWAWDAAASGYAVGFPIACIGNPISFGWYSGMLYEEISDPGPSVDEAPDVGWVGPVTNDALPPTPTPTPTPPPSTSPLGPTTFTPVTPSRLLDTRGAPTCSSVVPVRGRAGVPADAVAAAITVTVPSAKAPGYATLWPANTPQPGASNLNYRNTETRANSAVVQLGADGSIAVATSTCEPVIIDVSGSFVPSPGAAAAGRFVPLAPTRVYDAPSTSGATTTLSLAQLGVPADATAVSVNVTLDLTATGGYLTAWQAGLPQPGASMLNADGPHQTRAAAAIVPVSANGLQLWQNTGGRMIIDVTGYFTGVASPPSLSGMFVPQAPQRVMDTRPSRISTWTSVGGVPAGAAAIAVNVTITDPASSGWLTAAPTGQGNVNATSTVNASGPGDSIANFAIIPSAGGVSVAPGGTTAAALVDLAGWFTA